MPGPAGRPIALAAREIALLIDLIEIRLASMAVIDREDIRERAALVSARAKLRAA